jgi:hypothetical protein
MADEPLGFWVGAGTFLSRVTEVSECCRLPQPQVLYVSEKYRCPKGHYWEYQPRPLVPLRVEHRFVRVATVESHHQHKVECSCGWLAPWFFDAHDAVMAWAEHAGLKK